MNSVPSVAQSPKKIFYFGGNKNNEPIKPKLTEEKQQKDVLKMIEPNEKEILKITKPSETTSFKNVDDEKCRSCNTVYSKGKFGGNFDSRIYFHLIVHKLLILF
jgi:hypothetical protein